MTVVSFCACSSSPRVASISDSSKTNKSTANIHIVKQGETLYSIAWSYGLDYHSLASFNAITPPYTIHSKQKIRLTVLPNRASVEATPSPNKLAIKRTSIASNKIAVGAKPISQGKIKEKKRSEIKTNIPLSQSNRVVAYSALKWQWPATGKVIALFQGASGLNKGIDLEGKLGEPVIAAAAGQVVYSGGGLRGYGKLLIIKHNEIFLSAYAHNNELLVKEGDFVKVGQRIADMGSSGSNRVKLHFEIRAEGTPEDPLKYLPKH